MHRRVARAGNECNVSSSPAADSSRTFPCTFQSMETPVCNMLPCSFPCPCLQSALHVPALQANACFATARALEAVPVSSAPPVLLADLHSSMEPAQPQPDDLGLASCLATPVEGVNSPAESSARQAGAVRAAGMLR